jgi:hypothetical protein
MLTAYDRGSMARILTLDLEPRLHALLERRFASLQTPYGDLTDWTEFLLVEPGDREADIVREVGFSPLVDTEGARFGTARFEPFWDYLGWEDGYYTLDISFGSTFAYVLLITDMDGTLPELRCLCRRYTA